MKAISTTSSGMGLSRWLICIIASIGFAFDIYELLMPLIIKPVIASLSAPLVQELISGRNGGGGCQCALGSRG